MLIGYSMPAVNAVTLGAGSTWLTADAGSALFDGKPARATRIQRASGSPTINITLASAIVVRVIALLGLNLPPGVVVSALGTSGVTTRLADGTVACWLVIPAAAATAAVSVTLSTTQAMIQIGEVVVMPAVDVAHGPDWNDEVIDPTETVRTRASQASTNQVPPYRQLSATFTSDGVTNVRGGGLGTGMDWHALRAALTGDKRCVAILRRGTSAELHATALYGIGRIGAIAHLGGDYYTASPQFQEIPALT